MSSDGSITYWLGELKDGDEGAAQQQLWNRYFEQLVRLARQKLVALPQRAEDEEDVALSALDSFFQGMRAGRYPNLDDRTGLWPLLVTMTASKSLNQLKRQRTQKRGGGRVRGESIFEQPEIPGRGFEQIVGAQPTPEMAVQVSEDCERLLDSLESDQLRKVARLKLEGYSNQEIAHRLDVAERTVERKLKRIRKQWSLKGDES